MSLHKSGSSNPFCCGGSCPSSQQGTPGLPQLLVGAGGADAAGESLRPRFSPRINEGHWRGWRGAQGVSGSSSGARRRGVRSGAVGPASRRQGGCWVLSCTSGRGGAAGVSQQRHQGTGWRNLEVEQHDHKPLYSHTLPLAAAGQWLQEDQHPESQGPHTAECAGRGGARARTSPFP